MAMARTLISSWLRRQTLTTKILLAFAAASAFLLLIFLFLNDYDHLFAIASVVQLLGLLLLIYKLALEHNASGLSLKSQELTAIYLAARIIASFFVECDVHLFLDICTLATTFWVIYMMRFKLHGTVLTEPHNFPNYYALISVCAVLAIFLHPPTSRRAHWICTLVLWAFSCYVETVSMLPQLRTMQNDKIVEPFTSHYVFAMGIARFLKFAHWIILLVISEGRILFVLGYGLWPAIILVSEAAQTLILADFCYYYIKSVLRGESRLQLPRISRA